MGERDLESVKIDNNPASAPLTTEAAAASV
jgi:hypothetical protein